MLPVLTTFAAGLALAYKALDPYRVTKHGHNPWTHDAFVNVLRLHAHYDAAAKLVDGAITSVYRSPRVNAKAGGVATSYHLRGLAVDIAPRKLSPKEAARVIYEAAERGELGPVRKVLEEPGIVHIEYLDPTDIPGTIRLGYWAKPGTAVV